MLTMLFTLSLAIAIGIMVTNGRKTWNTPAVSSVGTQTDVEARELVPYFEHYEEIRRLQDMMESDMVPKYVYDAMVETDHRELNIYYAELHAQLQIQQQ